jgi:hypothetical protein
MIGHRDGQAKAWRASPAGQARPVAERGDQGGPDEAEVANQGGQAVYAARKCVVEPVFGQIKQARGFRQFLLRGKKKVKGEWALLCLTHNILRLHAAMQS